MMAEADEYGPGGRYESGPNTEPERPGETTHLEDAKLLADDGVRFLLDGLEVDSLAELRALVESGRIYAEAVGKLLDPDELATAEQIRERFGPPPAAEVDQRDVIAATFGAAAVRLEARRERLGLPPVEQDEAGALLILDRAELVAVLSELDGSWPTVDGPDRVVPIVADLRAIAADLGVES